MLATATMPASAMPTRRIPIAMPPPTLPLVRERVDEQLVVTGERDRTSAIAVFRQQPEELSEGAAVLSERRLVEHERAGRRGECGADRETSLLAAGQGEGIRGREL